MLVCKGKVQGEHTRITTSPPRLALPSGVGLSSLTNVTAEGEPPSSFEQAYRAVGLPS